MNVTGITNTTGSAWSAMLYSASGNLFVAGLPDSPGEMHGFHYDAWNRLVKITDYSGNVIATYEYDGLSRRIVKNVDPDDADVNYDYYYNTAWQAVEVRKDGNANPLKVYVWDARYIDAPAVRYYDENTNGNVVTHYYANDANMNVTALLDSTGAAVERYGTENGTGHRKRDRYIFDY